MDFTVIGLGYVGLTNAIFLASLGHEIIGYDLDKNKVSLLKTGVATLEEPNLQELLTSSKEKLRFTTNHKDAIRQAHNIFICVDTPQGEHSSVDLTNFNNVLDVIKEDAINDQTIIIRSTVPVGTNEYVYEFLNKGSRYHFDVLSFPEFLCQGKAVDGMINPYRLVIGTRKEALEKAKELAQAFLIKKTPVMITTPENAELIKYASNSFLAMKISFINNIARLCDAVGADVDKVAKGMALDPRIGSSCLKAGIGYGGSCFPKDTNGLYWIANDKSVPFELMKSTIEINETQIDYFMNQIYERFRTLSGLRVAVLGLSFKGGTEDTRNSKAIPVVKALLERNATVRVYDPLAMDNFHNLFSRHSHIFYMDYAKDALKDADLAIILNDSEEFTKLTAEDFITLMRKPVIYDGRNIFKLEKMVGTEYHSIGRPSVLEKTKTRRD